MIKKLFLTQLVIASMVFGCMPGNTRGNNDNKESKPDSVFIPRYAKQFKIKYYPDHKVIEVSDPWDSTAPPLVNVLAYNNEFHKKNNESILVPVKKWVAVSSTQISYASKLHILDRLVGMAEPEYVSNKMVQEGLKNGTIKNIGTAFSPDLEVLISLQPEMMMISPFKDDFYQPLRSAGIKLTTNSSYLENTPLGRVEWLVYVASFFNKEKEAIQIVDNIAQKYHDVCLLAKLAHDKPTVVTGKTYQGVWYVPAAESYNANFLSDAYVDYIFKDKHGTGSLNYDFETVYAAGAKCDFWSMLVHAEGEFSYSKLKEMDMRYADFDAFQNKNIIYSNTRNSMYYEKGLLEPDVILTDLVKLFHPYLLPHHQLVYYQKLTKE